MPPPYPFGQRQQSEGWKEERILGSGGFGTVTLWKHEERGEFLAVKKCRVQSEMSSKHKQRWTLECNIMLRLDHPHVIKAYQVPPEIDIRDSDLPLLAMEYCEGGDLRKVLTKPESSCGLSEFQIRSIICDVASAVEYLHSRRIIHRDLKPENIVISSVDEKVVYKLIDLGYAKDLDQGSVCTSFVGTMQYLAPELFLSQKYTCTVDYWSFGTLVFECCVGQRPFLHNIPPVKWLQDVAKKHKDEIHAFLQDGKIQFSKSIPQPHNLCSFISPGMHNSHTYLYPPDASGGYLGLAFAMLLKRVEIFGVNALSRKLHQLASPDLQGIFIGRTTKFYVEQWLRYMLTYDPKERGGGVSEVGRPRCFGLLENILNTKLLHVFCVPTNELLSYPIADDKVMLRDVMLIINQETAVELQDQEILLANGATASPQDPAFLCLAEVPNGETEEWIVFLLNSKETEFPPRNRKVRQMPDKVNDLINEPKTLTTFQEMKQAWSHAFYFCRNVRKDYDRLISAHRALMLCLLRHNSYFTKLRQEMTNGFSSLRANLDFFQQCQDFDVTKYEEQSKMGISSEKMYTNWSEISAQVSKFGSMQSEVQRLEGNYNSINQKVMELNRSPYSKNKFDSSLREMEDESLQLYARLRQTPPEQRSRQGDNGPVVQLLVKVLSQRQKLTEELYRHMSKVLQCRAEMLIILPKVKQMIQTIQTSAKRLMGYQLQRQKDIWTLVNVALRQTKALQQKQQRSSGATSNTPQSMKPPPSLPVQSYHQQQQQQQPVRHPAYQPPSLQPYTNSSPTAARPLSQSMHNLGMNETTPSPQMIARSQSKSSVSSTGSQSGFVIEKFSEQSSMVMAENHDTRNKLQSMLLSFHKDNLQKEPLGEALDWEFLSNQRPSYETTATNSRTTNSYPVKSSSR